ncbi:MAG: large repetitive protein [Acidobacteriota bacterium]|nr:large repetitive protein [Acidobacteriota bacterium]
MSPHAKKLFLFACSCALALVCADARVSTQNSTLRRITNTPESTTSLNPSLSGDGRRIVFESTASLAQQNVAAQFRAFTADVSADAPTFSLVAPTRAPASALSQDGTSIAFASTEDLTGENADRNSEIFLSTDGQLNQLTRTSPADPSSRTRDGNFQPSISDDGHLVAFSSNRDLTGENADGNFEIFLYDVAARRFTQLTHTLGISGSRDAKLSGDGSRVAFVRNDSNVDSQTAQLDLLTCETRTPLCSTTAENVVALTLSPARAISDDGTRIVYSAQTATNTTQVFLCDERNGGITRQITKLNSRVSDVPLDPAISGDGSRITFATRRSVVGGNSDASVELYLYDIPTNQISRITDAPASATAEVVSSLNDDGSLVAFNFPRVLAGAATADEFSNNSEIFLASLAPREPFSANLRLRHGATPDLTLISGKTLASGQIAIALGVNLALDSAQTQRLADGSFPFSFKNTSVTVNNRPAQLLYVSPTQINFQIPDATESGIAQIVVRNHDGYESRTTVEIATAAPGIFTVRGDGTGAAIALDSATLLAAPFDPHDAAGATRRVIIFATGLRHAASVSVNIAGRVAAVEAIIPSRDLSGLDEVHVALPRSLAGAGVVPVTISADGRTSNQATLQLTGQRAASRLVLAPANATLGVGRSLTFTTIVFDEDGIEIANAPVSFTSDDSQVATINEQGRALALRVGETKIRATSGVASAEAALRVRPLSLTINEVLVDPPEGAAGDANRDGTRSASQDEFVEIVNAADADIDLGSYQLTTRATNGVDATRHAFPRGTILAAGTAVAVFGGANAATFNPFDPAFGGALVQTASTGGLSLINGGGTITLRDPSGAIVDELNYGGASALEGDRNQSLTRAPDVLGDFALHASPAEAAGKLFSPGTRLDSSPFRASITVSRVVIDPPSAELRTDETQRFTAHAFNEEGLELSGVIYRWRSSDDLVASVNTDGNVRALKVGVVGITAEARGTISTPARLSIVQPPPRIVRVEIASPSTSLNRGATTQLSARAFDPDGLIVSDANFTWRSDDTSILSVDQSGLSRGTGFGVAHVSASTGDGAGGTVSIVASIDVQIPIVISEILADVPPDNPATIAVEGDANRDGVRDSNDDEFVELLNPSAATVDLSGVRISDATADRFTFPTGTTLDAGRALVVFGGGNLSTHEPAFGGSLIFKASSLSLNDGGDIVTLKLKIGTRDATLASQGYGTQGDAPAPSDQSLTRERANATGGLANIFVAHAAAANAAARPFSPGAYPDGTPFGSPQLTRIEITPASASLDIAASQVFTARAFTQGDGGERELPNVSFVWDASTPALLSIAPASGDSTIARAVAAGPLNIRARAGGLEANAQVRINPPPPALARVELSPQSATLSVGDSRQFAARAFDQYEQPYAPARIDFASTDQTLASVDAVVIDAGGASATATLNGRHEGSVRLTATALDANGVSKSAGATLLIVTPPPIVKRIIVSPTSASINRGQSRQLNAQAFDQNGQPVVNVTFSWTTTNAQVAAISTDGLARGVGIGEATVVATSADGAGGTVSGQATINVIAPLVINEILADVPPDNPSTTAIEGDANRDGIRNANDDEFIELLNNSDAPLDLSGIVIADSTSNRFTFPAGASLAAGQAASVFGGGSPPARDPAFGGALVFVAASLGLNDGGDNVIVKLPASSGDITIASQAFGSIVAGAPAAPIDQSLTRSPDAEIGSAGGGFIAHSTATNAAARIYSPGTRADGTPFGSSPLTRIEITPASASLDLGAQQTFAARAFAATAAGEIEIFNVSFAWEAGDATKISLAPTTGISTNVVAVAAGTTNVRARASGLQVNASLVVNPPPPVLTRVALTPATAAINVGATQQFTARAFDQFDQPFIGATYVFTSDDAGIARVESVAENADGSVVATAGGRGVGAAHITAQVSQGESVITSNTATLTVNPPPPVLTRIAISPSSATIATGETRQFNAQGFDQNGQQIVGLGFTWTSSDHSVATLDAAGLATGQGAGVAQIIAASGGITSDPATLQVNAPPVAGAGQVIINEALVSFATPTPSPSPTPQRADFIELYNTTAQTLDISGLVVSFRPSGSTNTPAAITLPGAVGSLTTLIVPHSYFLIANGAQAFGTNADYNASASGFDLNNTTGGIKIEIGGAKLDGLTYQSGTTAPAAPFNVYGEGTLLIFTSGTTNDLIRSPNATNTHNNATDFKRNGTIASVTPRAANP